MTVILPEEAAAFDRGGATAVAELRAAALSLGDTDGTWIAQLVGGTGGRRDQLTSPMTKSEWAYACIHAICTNLSTLPITVYRGPKRKGTPVENGPVFELFQSPYNGIPTEDWQYRVAMWLLLRGESFTFPFYGGQPLTASRIPDQLIPCAPTSVMAREVGQNKLVAWSVSGTNIELAQELVPQVLYPHPNSRWRGLSPMDVAFAAADAAYQASLFNSEFLKNSGFLGGVISSESFLGPEKVAALERQIKDKHAGPQKAGNVLILPKGQTFTPNPVTHRDAQFLEGQKFQREAICAVFGVPLSVIGGQAVNYATKLSDDKCFWERGVLPVARRIEQYYNAWLRRMGAQEWIAFDASEVAALQEDLGVALDRASKLSALGYTTDEINERLRLRMPNDKPWRKQAWTNGAPTTYASLTSTGGDTPPAADGALPVAGPVQDTAMNGAQIASLQSIVKDVALGVMPAESAVAVILAAFPAIDPAKAQSMVAPAKALAEKEAPAPPAKPEAPPAPPAETPPAAPDPARGAPAIHVRESRSERLAASAKYTRKVVLPAERKVTRVGVQFLNGCRRDMLALFDSRAFSVQDLQRIADLHAKWNARIREVYEAPLRATMEAAAKETFGHLGSTVNVDFNDPRWLSTVRDRLEKLTSVNETTVERARSALVQGLADSVSTADLRRSLEEVFDGNGSRALLVSRTEVGSVASSARDEAYGEAGIERTEWLSAQDDVVRESHAKVDGEIVERGQKFSNDMQYPHDPSADADEVCNCRCDHAPVL